METLWYLVIRVLEFPDLASTLSPRKILKLAELNAWYSSTPEERAERAKEASFQEWAAKNAKVGWVPTAADLQKSLTKM